MAERGSSSRRTPRVLLVTRNLPPLLGGMERLNLHVALELLGAFEVMIIGPSGCPAHLPSVSQVREVPHNPVWSFLAAALARAVVLASRFRPRCVIAGSGLAAPIALLTARLCGARWAVYVHGLDIVAPHPAYRMLWHPVLRRADLCIANSRHTAGLAKSIGIPESRIVVLNPGVELPSSGHSAVAGDFRRRHGLGSRKVLLSVGRMTPRKGLLEFIERSLPAVTERHPDAILVIVGDEAPDAVAGSGVGMGKRIAGLARSMGLEKNVLLLGVCEDSELAAAYRAADVLVFPVRHIPGDTEGFGMVAVEAAAHGLRTVAFLVGGVQDAVGEGRSGYLVPPDDYALFADRVHRVLAAAPSDAAQRQCRAFAASFTWPRFGAQLRLLIQNLIDDDRGAGRAAYER